MRSLLSERFAATVIMTVVLAFYALQGLLLSQAKSPWIDEAWVAQPAINLLEKGQMVASFLEPANPDMLQQSHRYTYWMPPLWFLQEAAWFKVVGTGLDAQRALSLAWGGVLIVAIYALARSLGVGCLGALAASAILACDSQIIYRAADGRMDIAVSALIYLSLLAYLALRKRNLTGALLLSNALIVCAGLTHPVALVGAVALWVWILCLDAFELKWKTLGVSAIPYVLGGLAWGLYILQAPDLFMEQFFGKTPGAQWNPIQAVIEEVSGRYFGVYGLASDGAVLSWGALVPLVLYAVAVLLVVLLACVLRKRSLVLIAVLCVTLFMAMAVLIGYKADYNLPTILPAYTLACGAVACELSRSRMRVLQGVCALLILLLMLSMVRITGARIRIDDRGLRFAPVVRELTVLREETNTTPLLFAPPEVLYALGFPEHARFDYYFGYYSGDCPDIIVLRPGEVRRLNTDMQTEGSFPQYLHDLLEQKLIRFETEKYTLYLNRDLAATLDAPLWDNP